MAVTKNSDRQYPLVAYTEFAYSDFALDASFEAVMDLPDGAVVIGGEIIVDTAFNSGTSCVTDIGDTADADEYATAIDLTTAGRSAFETLTGYKSVGDSEIGFTITEVGNTATAGAGRLIVQYVIADRANENQG